MTPGFLNVSAGEETEDFFGPGQMDRMKEQGIRILPVSLPIQMKQLGI